MKEPKVRLKRFSGEWEESPFSEIANRTSASASSLNFPGVEFEDINSGEGTLNKDVRRKKIIKIGKQFTEGDVLFGKLRPYLKNILLANFNGVAIGDFWVLRPQKVTSELLYIVVNSREFMRIANISSGSKMPRADWNLVSSTSFAYPETKEEQNSIGAYFLHLESLIQSTTKKIESLKQVKAASLQSMFPQNGETTPRVRFKGFEGEWETVSLNSLCRNAASQLTESTLGENKGCYPVFGASGYLQNIEEYAFDVPYIGIIKDGSGVGRSQLYPACSSILGTMQYIIPNSGIDASYLACVFEGIDLTKFITGSTIPHIYFRDYCTLQLMMPSEEEQKKIGRYFTNLDSQITLQTQRLEKLKQIKSACLDNMFV